MPSKEPHSPARSELLSVLLCCRGAFIGVATFSAASNLLMLTGSIFMLQVYDRVLPSRSVPTLVAMAILAGGLFSIQALLDIIRGRLLVRVGASLDEKLNIRIYQTLINLPLKSANYGGGTQPLRDLDTVRSFLSGFGPSAIFDLPWLPVFLAVIFAFHPLLGVTALAGAIVLIALTVFTELLTRAPIREANAHGMVRNGLATANVRNAEVVSAMGMVGAMSENWSAANRKYSISQRRVSDVTVGFGSASKVFRLMLQSAMLGVGAYLVIQQQATAGIIIASAILTARALAPVDSAIANWKAFGAARQSWHRLRELLAEFPVQPAAMQLPRPCKALSVHNARVVAPGGTRLLVQDVSFSLKRGEDLGIVGPNASGKSSLARMLVGVWKPTGGSVRIDGAALEQWNADALGRHIGYLPQNVLLLAGSIAQNISRFDPAPDVEAIVAAAKAAGAHELILKLPGGYDMQIEEDGLLLSAGHRQRVALARALYGDPFLVVLDEPSSNLDEAGEAALTSAMHSVRARGGIVIVVAHRPGAIVAVNHLLVINRGRMQAFGAKEEILSKMLRPETPATPLKVVASGMSN